jgi:hypothetical protein
MQVLLDVEKKILSEGWIIGEESSWQTWKGALRGFYMRENQQGAYVALGSIT